MSTSSIDRDSLPASRGSKRSRVLCLLQEETKGVGFFTSSVSVERRRIGGEAMRERDEAVRKETKPSNEILIDIGDEGKNIIDEEEFEDGFDINYEDSSEDHQSDGEPALGLDPKGMFYF
ncbi:hypothetical protein MA16_Dca005352 [Dendrobium catenatum]|uniref:Uncharacterized protein n=1 Tax=Dendrobium catenatum TaxID=906689 RepID=A0A2I0X383_9ASPA|nr:hypothetical protein MA16_Dca005352 [Dendrobium catenatum]